jgi:hypothetical protein
MIDAFSQRDEGGAERVELLEQQHKVLQIPAEAVEPPADNYVKPPPCGRGDQVSVAIAAGLAAIAGLSLSSTLATSNDEN